MEEQEIKLLRKEFVTHDTKSFLFEKPKNLSFSPGQATEIALIKEGFEE